MHCISGEAACDDHVSEVLTPTSSADTPGRYIHTCQGLTTVPQNMETSTLGVILTGNRITSLPVDVFGSLPKCHSMDVSYNRIQTVSIGAFNGLPSLRSLILSNNQIRHLSAGVFHGLNSLLLLMLKHNQLRVLEPGLFTGLNQLIGIWLNNNQLKVCKKTLFSQVLLLFHAQQLL